MGKPKCRPRGMGIELEQVWQAECVNRIFDALDDAGITYTIRYERRVVIHNADIDLTFRSYTHNEQMVIEVRRICGRETERKVRKGDRTWLPRLMKTIEQEVDVKRRVAERLARRNTKREAAQARAMKMFKGFKVKLDERVPGDRVVLKVAKRQKTVARIIVGEDDPDSCTVTLNGVNVDSAKAVLELMGHKT